MAGPAIIKKIRLRMLRGGPPDNNAGGKQQTVGYPDRRGDSKKQGEIVEENPEGAVKDLTKR